MLRHQLTVLRRRLQARVRLTNNDRWYLIVVYRWFPSILQVLTIIRPETLIRWHRSGFRCYWRWKSGPSGGRPQIEAELRALIRRMSIRHDAIAVERLISKRRIRRRESARDWGGTARSSRESAKALEQDHRKKGFRDGAHLKTCLRKLSTRQHDS